MQVSYIQYIRKWFFKFYFWWKKKIILIGRRTPNLKLTKQSFVRHFYPQNYKTCEWLTGCAQQITFILLAMTSFCNNLQKLIKRHSSTEARIQSIIKEKMSVNTRIAHPLNDQLEVGYEQHNWEKSWHS